MKLSCDVVLMGPSLTPESLESWMTLQSCSQLWSGHQALVFSHIYQPLDIGFPTKGCGPEQVALCRDNPSLGS